MSLWDKTSRYLFGRDSLGPVGLGLFLSLNFFLCLIGNYLPPYSVESRRKRPCRLGDSCTEARVPPTGPLSKCVR